ncbi:MAG: Uma2 family endonuclease [Anaerolineae bacterium]|nr:Uma2 family endonuclease [Anaerolineae bacterium]
MSGVQARPMTGADLLALPMGQGERYELIEGTLQIMTPAGGRHGQIVDAISGEFYVYLKQHRTGVGIGAETGFYTRGNERTVRAPDYALIRAADVPDGGLPEGYLTLVPVLVVEVISPTDRAADVDAKVQEWLAFGVPLVWVVYPNTARVFVYTQDDASPTVFTMENTITGGDLLPGFNVAVRTFFETP